MTLSEKQRKFTIYVARLIDYAYRMGYELSFGEAYRTPEQAALNVKNGSGILNSLHCKRLAVDLNLFKDGEYLRDSSMYAFLGSYWKTLNPLCCWGGDFVKVDGNHFSLSHEGIK